ncbi:methyl-accepting chemotaxis protein [Bosea sp. (in: a-proteobacteria)]|uniref:methyl-accepting chemotaxis protein n=1 Tax=Bosea sp. (in: a-proteobacteria) TaxID=1871050 RepID=UPI002B48A288|nr:methyl-accepting chemotaxis protein [Bosea sp. (in: a-proteobacteria)]WRH58070.1 MAG: methyl-accepting chemotaxis protein [Bosea sp. (in: a-proteobacteria)]
MSGHPIPKRSMGTRLIVVVLTMTAFAFAGVAGFIAWRLDQNLLIQSAEMYRLSKNNLSQRLESDARRGFNAMEKRFHEIGEDIGRISKRNDIIKLLMTSNITEIKRELNIAVAEADLTGLMIFDHKMRYVEGFAENLDTLAWATNFSKKAIFSELSSVLYNNNRSNPKIFERIVQGDAALLAALGSKAEPSLVSVMAYPVFDDFGDVFAVMVASRRLKEEEATLKGLNEIVPVAMAVVVGRRIVSSVGLDDKTIEIETDQAGTLRRSTRGNLYYRCTPAFAGAFFCAFAPEIDLTQQSDTLTKIGRDQTRAVSISVLMIAFGAMLSLGVVLFFVMRRVTRPLARIAQVIERVSNGEAETADFGAGRNDEIGQIARAVKIFQDNLVQTERMRAERREDAARADEERQSTMQAMADRFEASVGEILRSVSVKAGEMRSAAGSMAEAALKTSSQAKTIEANSESTAVSIAAMNRSTQELVSSIEEISRRTVESAQLSNTAVEVANYSGSQINNLTKKANQIGDIVNVISTIAAQTNLLALNATIEAARAGVSGKGFSVVASEVKILAERTAQATKDIGERIHEVQIATKDSFDSIEEVADIIRRLSHSANDIATFVKNQDLVTQTIALNVSDASSRTAKTASGIIEISKESFLTGAIASQMRESAEILDSQCEQLNAKTSQFLSSVRH